MPIAHCPADRKTTQNSDAKIPQTTSPATPQGAAAGLSSPTSILTAIESLRFSSIEYELVAGYAKDSGYPISTFVRKQALSEKVTVNYNIVADIGEIQNLTAQAAGIGNNLNQIARYFHGGGLASRGMLEELKKCIAEIRELRQEIVQLGGVYRGNSKTHRK